jgi:hypothetical protein
MGGGLSSPYSLTARFIKVFYIAIHLLIILGGCATKDALKSVSDEDILRERVMAYWDYKVKGEFDKSYEYEHPLFKKQTSMVKYIQGFKSGVARWLGTNVEDIEIKGDTAEASVNVKTVVRIPRVKPIESDSLIKEKWVKTDGMWYHVPAGLIDSPAGRN